jgi:hypothetical protein
MPTRTIPVATVYTENRVKSRLSRNDRFLAQGGPQEDQFCFRWPPLTQTGSYWNESLILSISGACKMRAPR